MENFQKIILAIILLGVSLYSAQSQQSVVVAGSDILNKSGSVSYSIGQISYVCGGTGMTISPGVQQTYGKLVMHIDSNISITVWPNPVSDLLNINVSDKNDKGMVYQLYSIDARLLESKKVNENSLNISMANYTPGTYILVVTHLSQRGITFKINKN
ncbi:MAG: T9SS type A sorting domain-containing protein [Bacteroidia bacterium]|jgi:Secretion system C-terminal sorting domain